MSTAQKSKQKSYIKLGFAQEETTEVVNKLNQLLADYHIHYQKLRNFHWNVTGADFFDLHEKFEIYYNEAKFNIDEIAERVRVFGKTPLSTLKDYLKISHLKEVGTELSSSQMVDEVLADFRMLIEDMNDALESAIDAGDMGTQDMLNAFIKIIEKNHWMLTAFSGK